jgi:hypothetical protein
MRHLLLVLLGRIRRAAPHVLSAGLFLMSLASIGLGCASPSLMTETQVRAIRDRDRALASHASAIQAAIGQSRNLGALAFLDAKDGRLVVLPGDSAADAWSRHTTSPTSEPAVSVPPVLTFVHRADVPKAPEAVTRSDLQHQQALGAMATELRDAHRRVEEQLGVVQRELANTIAATQQAAAARADMQTALTALSEELATVRKFMLQTAQLGWLNHELNVENASGIGKVAMASQELSASSERMEETLRQLSKTLAAQLKDLAARLDTIQGKVSSLK